MAEYMRRFEQFNRDVYGSELFSLGNLQQDYNNSAAREDIGYDKIEIEVIIKNEMPESEYFKPKKYIIEELSTVQKNIESEIKDYEKSKSDYNNRSVKFYSKKSVREIASDFGFKEIPSTIPDYMIMDEYFSIVSNQLKGKYNNFNNCINDIQKYTNLTSIYTEFRTGKQFRCVKTVNNQYNGRLTAMYFEEI